MFRYVVIKQQGEIMLSTLTLVRVAINLYSYATSRKVAGSSPDEVEFFSLRNSSSSTMALGSTQPLTETSAGNFPRGKGQPARKADNLTVICEPIAYRKCGSLDGSQPYGPSRPVTGINLLFYLISVGTILHHINISDETCIYNC
jgi:hypothetical protein